MQHPIITVKEFNVSFGNNSVVRQLNFALHQGKTLAIVGESGSGKSVTSLALMGLLGNSATVSAEVCLFKGVDLLSLSEADFRALRGKDISMIFQEPMTSLNPAMTCGQQVAEVLQLHDKLPTAQAKTKTIEWFSKVKLPQPEAVYNKYPHQLSGGQRQRVMIAMAMCTSPQLLIADEPTTALDVTVQKEILHLLAQLQKETGMAMIFITHDLGVVKEIADDVLVLFRGETQEYGSAKQIIGQPQSIYTKGLLDCRPPLNSKPKRLPTVETVLNSHPETTLANEEKDSHEETQTSSWPLKQAGQDHEPLLQITNLHKFFPLPATGLFKKREKLEVLKGISLTVYKGETVGLVGESGCGKSTLGRNIIRLLEPEKGQILFKRQDITQLKHTQLRRLRKDIQIIFQDPYSSLNPKQKIGEAIAEPMAVHRIFNSKKQREEHAKDLLQKVGLQANHYHRYPHEFSGGQRQRIGIARALALKPEVIICDESVSALDVSVQAQVLNLLNDLKDEFGLTYIFISHDLSVVKYFSDRVAVMNAGQIVELNTSEEIYKHPQNDYTRKLLSAIPGIN